MVKFRNWGTLQREELFIFTSRCSHDLEVVRSFELNSPLVSLIWEDMTIVQKRFHRGLNGCWCLKIDEVVDLDVSVIA
jgi:hypothetical protein